MPADQIPCRCGWPGTGPHRCHSRWRDGDDVRCPNEGKPRRLLFASPPGSVALSGMQMKFAAQSYETVGCDACWTEFLAQVHTEDIDAAA